MRLMLYQRPERFFSIPRSLSVKDPLGVLLPRPMPIMARAGETSGSEAAKLGVSASFDVGTASEFADLAARSGEGGNILPLRYRAKKEGVIELDSSVTSLEVAGAIQDAWDAGFDAIRFKNYTTLPEADHPGPPHSPCFSSHSRARR